MLVSFENLTTAQKRAVIAAYGNKTIAEITARFALLDSDLDEVGFTLDDPSAKLNTLKTASPELYNTIIALVHDYTTEAETTTEAVVKTFNEMSAREKFAELQAKQLAADKANRLKKAVYDEAYVSIASISNIPSQAAKGREDYVEAGAGFIIIKDAIRKDGTKYSPEELASIVTEHQLSVKEYTYALDLLNAGQKYARVLINIENRAKDGVRRYRIEELTKSLNKGKTVFADAQLGREVTDWFNTNAVNVATPQGATKMVIVGMPTTNTNVESKFYPFKLVESGELASVQKIFSIREDVRVNEQTEVERTALLSSQAKVIAGALGQFNGIVGFNPNEAFNKMFDSLNK